MFELKPISKSSIEAALNKARQYRLLNEPRLAESICHDILDVAPDNHDALIILLLAVTDQLGSGFGANRRIARELLDRFDDEYERLYYAGIICERQGKAAIDNEIPDFKHIAYEWLMDAMEHYEKAEALRPSGNDDAILRWNTCVRLINRYRLKPRQEEHTHHFLE
jgi:hypothetical protein